MRRASQLVRQAFQHTRRALRDAAQRRRDSRRTSFGPREPEGAGLLELLGPFDTSVAAEPPPWLAEITTDILAHDLDLLGTGPTSVDRGVREEINRANAAESERLQALLDADYAPIDWQRDPRSGYRWSESTWYRDIRIHAVPGADIKLPWELGRMQHLVHLARAYGAAAAGAAGLAPAPQYAAEIRNQILDFVAFNPPRFGVAWASSMDVAIRVANWVLALELLRLFGARLDPTFAREVVRSVRAHAVHVADNLEVNPVLRGNHYLANLVGLLFASAALPRSPQTEAWRSFAARELVTEVDFQFHADGTHFEASTCYHRLATELVIYGMALLSGLAAPDRPDLPAWTVDRLERMLQFTMDITKPNGQVVQIGDNDSGRLFAIDPAYRAMPVDQARQRFDNLRDWQDGGRRTRLWVDDSLDHDHLLVAMLALLGPGRRPDRLARSRRQRHESPRLEPQVVRALARQTLGRGTVPPVDLVNLGALALLEPSKETWTQTRRIAIPGDDPWKGTRLSAYPGFGAYIYASERVFLCIRCGSVGQLGFGGHAHNDQLSLELSVDGEDWIVDPGSYLYTGSPALRNAYRSVLAHFAPVVEGREPASLDRGLFCLGHDPRAECLHFEPRVFAGVHTGYGAPLFRVVRLVEDGLEIQDVSYAGRLADRWPGRQTLTRDDLAPSIPFSPGYGLRLTGAWSEGHRQGH